MGNPEISPITKASAAAGGSFNSLINPPSFFETALKAPLSRAEFDITRNGKIEGINDCKSEIIAV